MVGDRALFCLDANTGKHSLAHAAEAQPLGRPGSVQGDTVVVRRQHDRLRSKAIKGAKGFIAAFARPMAS